MRIRSKKSKASPSLPTTLATAFITLILAVLLTASAFQMYFNFRTQQVIVAAKQRFIAQNAANRVSNFIREKFKIMEAVSELGNPTLALPKEQDRLMENLLAIKPDFRHVILLDAKEKVLSSASRLSRSILRKFRDRIESDLFDKVKKDKRYISNVYIDEVTSEPMVIMAVQVKDYFGYFQGTLISEVNLKFMWDLVDKLKIGKTGLAYVVDRQGNLIAFGDTARVLKGENISRIREVGEFILKARHEEMETAHISSGINGDTSVGTYISLGSPDWAVVTELPVREAYKEVIQGVFISIGIILIMAMLAGLIGVYLARRLAIPLLNLTKTTTRIARGDTELQASIEGPAEVASLARAFNHMTGQLRNMLEEEAERSILLRETVRELEESVAIRKAKEAALYESEENLRTLIESSTDAIITTINTDSDRLITSINQAFKEMFGFDEYEVVNQSIRKIHVSEESFREFGQKIYPEIEKQGHWRGEWPLKRKDGTVFPTENSISPLSRYDDKREGFVSIIRDLTEKQKAELEKSQLQAQLRQAQKMEAIGTLAGGIAHDFNNILSPIMIHTEMVMADLPADSILQQNMKQIYIAAERARDLVKQILTFSRQKGHERVPIPIRLVLKEALNLLRSTLPSTIRIRQNLEAESGTILADPTEIHQVIMNLSTNAAHAMREKGGDLKVSLTDETITSEGNQQYPDLIPGNYLKLALSDSGEGMNDEVMKRIFEPYYTTKGPGEGTGMGLAVAHGIVKSYGGEITVKSEIDKGTTFHILLPKIEGGVPEKEEPRTSVPRGVEKILFIDDEKTMVDSIKPMLEGLGYTVTGRTSSIEALEVFRNDPNRFDLVITDQTMPNMTGKELAKEFMSIRPGIPIILCTGFSEQIDEKKSKEMGIKSFIMKPIVMSELAELIRKALDK